MSDFNNNFNDAENMKTEITKEKLLLEKERLKAKADAEAHETALIAQDPTKSLQTKLNLKVAEHIDNSKAVAEKIEQTADKLVEKGLRTQENKADAGVILSEDEKIEADYKQHSAEYLYHGIDHKVDRPWKRKVMLIINDIWFVIFAIISFFSIVPVSMFLSRIKALSGFVRWLAIVVGVVLLLACLFGLTYGCLRWVGVI